MEELLYCKKQLLNQSNHIANYIVITGRPYRLILITVCQHTSITSNLCVGGEFSTNVQYVFPSKFRAAPTQTFVRQAPSCHQICWPTLFQRNESQDQNFTLFKAAVPPGQPFSLTFWICLDYLELLSLLEKQLRFADNL